MAAATDWKQSMAFIERPFHEFQTIRWATHWPSDTYDIGSLALTDAKNIANTQTEMVDSGH